MSAPVTLPSLVVGSLTRLTYYLKFAAPRELSIKKNVGAKRLRDALDPIHFGLMNLLSRYAEPRQRLPNAEILMARDVMSLFTVLRVGREGPQALDLGAELMKAEIASRLSKRHAQDSLPGWGCAEMLPTPCSKDSTAQAANSSEPPTYAGPGKG
jgi:hypothetical protein